MPTRPPHSAKSRYLEPGSNVAGYRVVRVLGSGGTSVVYLVEPRAALKISHRHISDDPAFRQQLIKGARLATALRHPNIVSIHNHGETVDGLLWMATQYVDGIDADAELRAGRMNPARTLRIILQIATALDYAHSLDIAHGDIKPANFLLSQGDSLGERVQLADFELARRLDDDSGRDGQVLISAAYTSPEALLGHGVDRRGDIYSLGCALFRLLTGKPPFFDAKSKSKIIAAQLHLAPPRATSLAPWLPAAVDEVIDTAMAKDPAARYSTARDLALAAAAAFSR